MAKELDKLEKLSEKLDRLLSMHNEVSNEIDSLRVEILRLKIDHKNDLLSDTANKPKIDIGQVLEIETEKPIEANKESKQELPIGQQETTYFESRERRVIGKREISPKRKIDFEKVIGKNLISKLGMLILIIGIAIFAKLSIENEWISPLGRVVIGYIVGLILLGLGMYLKKNYHNFSAVLVSGAMAIFYFITFFAYDFYHLMGQEIAFGLMVIFTIFTVLAALNYNKPIIAHLGLVGAVSVPFLLSNDSGNALFLFSYIALINIGIAFISLKKNWKSLFYSAFAITWIVYFTWLVINYKTSEHFTLTFGFLTLYFVLFYVIFIAYKFITHKKYKVGDVIILLLNSFIFFGIGYTLLKEHEVGNQLLGLFALANALIHFSVAIIIKKQKLADRNLLYLVIGLVIVSLTLAIPIQLEGLWITIMWSVEALILFYIGRSRNVTFYEYLSFGLMAIAGISLSIDWQSNYYTNFLVDYYSLGSGEEYRTPIINRIFLTSFVTSVCMGLIFWIHKNLKWKAVSKINTSLSKFLDYSIPIAFLLVVYFALRMEILHYFLQLYASSVIEVDADNSAYAAKIYNVNIRHKLTIWLANYSLVFMSLVSFYVYNKVKDKNAKWALLGFNLLTIILSLLIGLYELSEWREYYFDKYPVEYFRADNAFIWMRYVFIGSTALLIIFTYKLLKSINKSYKIYALAESIFYLLVLWISTSEMIHWLDFTNNSETYGLALSIYWGIFSVIIIAFGIWKKKKHLRILGIAIFAITLVKLFFYDLSQLTTIAKTIVMISLGALLLLTSFLYNKYTLEDEGEM